MAKLGNMFRLTASEVIEVIELINHNFEDIHRYEDLTPTERSLISKSTFEHAFSIKPKDRKSKK